LRGVWGNPWGFESPLRHHARMDGWLLTVRAFLAGNKAPVEPSNGIGEGGAGTGGTGTGDSNARCS